MINNFQYQIDDGQTGYDESLKSLKAAKRTFDTSYLKANKLEELPDREEASYKAYLNEQAKAVKREKKSFDDWKKALENAQKSFTEIASASSSQS